MAHRIRVGDVMTRNFTYIKPDASILDAARVMVKNRVGSIVLKEGDQLHGIVTEKDIVWALTKKRSSDFNSIKAKDIASKKIISVKPESNIIETLQLMNRKKVRRLPVVSNKKLIGYVTLKDIVKFIPEVYDPSRSFEKIREESEKIARSESAKKGLFLEAPCEECGNFDILENIDGRMICESCKDNM